MVHIGHFSTFLELYYEASKEDKIVQDTRLFAVLFDARANTGIERMKFINVVAKSVPPPHKVDLSSPDKTIIVQVAKTICMVGVVEKYKELSKFNLRQLTSIALAVIIGAKVLEPAVDKVGTGNASKNGAFHVCAFKREVM
ncbi:hypothetical protein ACLOJK_000415 [Asimina triloba]